MGRASGDGFVDLLGCFLVWKEGASSDGSRNFLGNFLAGAGFLTSSFPESSRSSSSGIANGSATFFGAALGLGV